MSYRQASGFSVPTSISIKVPKDGYFKITMDPTESHLVGIINGADIAMSISSLVKSMKGYKEKSKEFTEKLTKELVEEKVLENLDKNKTKYPKSIWKIWTKQNLTTGQDVGSYGQSVLNNLKQLDVLDLVAKAAKSCGVSIGEDVFTYFSGPIGQVMKGLFTMTKIENLLLQCNDSGKLSGSGLITIKNSGGEADDTNSWNIYVGDTLQLTKSKGTKYRSSNKKVATVSKKGIVKAKKAGNVTITIKNGKNKQYIKITVTKKPVSAYKENIVDNGDLINDSAKTATIYKDMNGDEIIDKIYIKYDQEKERLNMYYNENRVLTYKTFDGYEYKVLKLDSGERFFYLEIGNGPGDSNSVYLYRADDNGNFNSLIELRADMRAYYVQDADVDGKIIKVYGNDGDFGTGIYYTAEYAFDGKNIKLCSDEYEAGYSMYDGRIAFHDAYTYGNLNLYNESECTDKKGTLPADTNINVLKANMKNYSFYIEGDGYFGWIKGKDIVGDENNDFMNYVMGLYPC